MLCGLCCISCGPSPPGLAGSVEGLLALSQELKDSKEKVDVLNELAFQYRLLNEDKLAGEAAIAANELAVRLEYGEGQAAASNVLGNLEKGAANYAEAEKLFKKALALRLKDGNKKDIASCYNNLGLLYSDWNDNNEKAVRSFEEGLEILNGARIPIAAVLLNNLGDVLSRLGRHDEAVEQLREGVAIRKALGDERGIAWSKLNLAGALQKVWDYKESGELLEESLAYFEKDSVFSGQAKCHLLKGNNAFYQQQYQQAQAHYETALGIKNGLDSLGIALIYRNQGSVLFQQGQNEAALEKYRFAEKQFEKYQDPRELAAIHYDIGNTYYDQSLVDTALNHYQQSLSILKAGSVHDPELQQLLMASLGDTYRRLERYAEAFDYKQQYNQARDSIAERAQKAIILEKQLAKEETEADRRKIILYGAAGAIILWLLLALAVLYAYNQQKKRKIADQEVDSLLQRQELALITTRQEAEDRERNRIARDLHDELGSMLTIIKMHFESLHSRIDKMEKEALGQYQSANELLEKAFHSIRSIARDLQSLDHLGLKEALASLVNNIQGNKKLSVELATYGLEERMDRKLEYELFKIVQTLVSNVLKHSEATRLSIQVNRFDSLVNVMVEDNGVGFDPENARKADGIGLNSVEIRADSLGGTMRIDSAKGKGATILVDIPWKKKPTQNPIA